MTIENQRKQLAASRFVEWNSWTFGWSIQEVNSAQLLFLLQELYIPRCGWTILVLMAHKSKITPGKTENQLGMYFNTSAFKGKFLLASKGWFVQWVPGYSEIFSPNLPPSPRHFGVCMNFKGATSCQRYTWRCWDCDQSTGPSEVELAPHVFAHWPARVSWSSPGRSKSPNLRRKWGVKLQLSVLIWRKGFKFNKS